MTFAEFAEEKRSVRATASTEALREYWNSHVPQHICAYDEPEAIRVLLFMSDRYEKILCRIAKESPEWRYAAVEALGLLTMEQVERESALD